MDAIKAKTLEDELKGQSVGGWTITSLINHGKSAAVFEASRAAEIAAVKVFDNELLVKYGDSVQLARIDRELELIGQHHENLVRILDGGLNNETGYYFIAMEYLRGDNLAQCLQDVPFESLPLLIEQLASAAHFLEERDLCHRDIKPKNIVLLDNFKRLVLLDLGILRPIGAEDLTDESETLPFIGTAQYSSPEFLLRQEKDTHEGWRALTFYQIGAVLSDLIMRKPLFEEFKNPYARLVNAVQYEIPEIKSTDAPANLVNLAGRCLVKDPATRTDLVSWDDFKRTAGRRSGRQAKRNIANRIALMKANRSYSEGKNLVEKTASAEIEQIRRDAIDFLKASVRSIRHGDSGIPRARIYESEEHTLNVCFEKSPEHLLNDTLTIFLFVEILDPLARIIAIMGDTRYGSASGRPLEPKPSDVIFRGPYDGDQIFSELEGYIYDIFDAVQDTPPVETGEAVCISRSEELTDEGNE